MRTSMNIPVELLQEAQKLTECKTKTQAVILALQEMIQKRKIKNLLDLKGSMSDSSYDHKKSRKKR